MKIVAIDGTGLIGSKAVAIVRRGAHDVVAAPDTGVNTITGEGLMAGTRTCAASANPREA